MAGNVFEWCSTLFRDYPYDPEDGREEQERGAKRVLRGGSYGLNRSAARCAVRANFEPAFILSYIRHIHPNGFRVARHPEPN
jgi:formylglycine-generating enzyme required for sulfatase activity